MTPDQSRRAGFDDLTPSTPSSEELRRGLADFHAAAAHTGPADGCADCDAVEQRQRQARSAFRRHTARTAVNVKRHSREKEPR